jgi:predicted amidohydrolase
MSRKPVKVAAIQMVSSTRPQDNLEHAQKLVAKAAAAGARVVLLPEYFCLLGNKDTDKVAIREEFGHGMIQDTLAKLAAEHHLGLLGGTLPLTAETENKVRNTLLAFGPDGRMAARYDKIHLFNFHHQQHAFDEARTIQPGASPTVLEAEIDGEKLRIGLSVCYDLRFPELYRALGVCDLMVVPSAFTDVTGKAHWEVLLRARAIENQCYVLAAAQGGLHENKRTTFGHSILIDPWGEVKACLDEGEGVVAGEIDFAWMDDVRSRLPALTHRTM